MAAFRKWQYYVKNHTTSVNYIDYLLKTAAVTGMNTVNGKEYFNINSFFDFPNGTLVRYDTLSQKIIIRIGSTEYTFMDFSKFEGENFQQIQSDGSVKNVLVITDTLSVLGDEIIVKGFYREGSVFSWCYFAPEIGWIFQDQHTGLVLYGQTDLFLIEYLIRENGQNNHKKHSETASLNLQPVTFIPDGDSLYKSFTILHPLSKQFSPVSYGYFSYINAYLQSFYFNGADTIWNQDFIIQQITEKDFLLNYHYDTTKYNQGYHLYYRIAAVDKGIIADTFYSPEEGYYKLFWKDSITSAAPTEVEILSYSLSQNYPNPFNPVTKILFTIPERDFVALRVFDVLGSEICLLINEELNAGKYEIDFSGNELSSGIYFYQIKTGDYINTRKMLLLK